MTNRADLLSKIPPMALSMLNDIRVHSLAQEKPRRASTRITFLGGARYSRPLDATTDKKFKALKSLGELFVIGYSQSLRPRRFTEHARFYLLPKLPLAALRYLEMFAITPFLVCWLIFRHGVQILVAQSPYEGFAAAAAKKFARCFGYRLALVVESHGNFEESLLLQRRVACAGIYRFLMRHAARFSLKHADLLRAVSTATKQQLEAWSPGKSIIRFPAWTDMDVFLQAGNHEQKNFSQSILYAGVLTPLKGVHHLLNAFANIVGDFPQARLILVGRAQNKSYAADLKQQVERAGLNAQVQFIDALPQVELALWMQKACVLALPSASEGLGRVVIEAMATGTPVIGSDVGGIPEIVNDGATGFLVPPGDEQRLTEKLRWILENPDQARQMGRRARAFAERFFSTEAYIDGYRRVFIGAQSLVEPAHAHSSL
jgi:glycosyltransferase involved in cell wall biosynthesis